ncbi:UspA domain protein [Desulfamplus magnetovallimortis]|uniref:UspA domain protein n=1 Tax=Desulfamplus magnetovallimortis TaxID=1246637 RepID=A0A1W1HGF6_9BACT|nr:universal stress protein [Desulfamplus magnetovallimortis]SLM31475.1 UspA domain protein [Desulfamplus magnetovallimortis]
MKILVSYDKDVRTTTVMEKALQRAVESGAYAYLVKTCASDAKQEEIIEIEKKLNYHKDEFDKKGIQCETHVLIRGLAPGEDIVKFAKEKQVDEIIYGMKKESRVGKLVFGSNVQFIILEAHCPVLTVKQV